MTIDRNPPAPPSFLSDIQSVKPRSSAERAGKKIRYSHSRPAAQPALEGASWQEAGLWPVPYESPERICESFFPYTSSAEDYSSSGGNEKPSRALMRSRPQRADGYTVPVRREGRVPCSPGRSCAAAGRKRCTGGGRGGSDTPG